MHARRGVMRSTRQQRPALQYRPHVSATRVLRLRSGRDDGDTVAESIQDDACSGRLRVFVVVGIVPARDRVATGTGQECCRRSRGTLIDPHGITSTNCWGAARRRQCDLSERRIPGGLLTGGFRAAPRPSLCGYDGYSGRQPVPLTPICSSGYSASLESRASPPYLPRLAPTPLRAGHARIAQSVEHILGKDEVIGSIPIASSVRPAPPRRIRLVPSGARADPPLALNSATAV